jgi:phospholipase C
MKVLAVLLAATTATALYAQDPNLGGKIKHVIVVIQENRTPDNLFGSQQANPGQFFEAGVNLATQGKCLSNSVALQPQPIYASFDIGHEYPDFVAMWDGGAMDGASNEFYTQGSRSCTNNVPAPFAYIDNSVNTSPSKEVQPYFDIATQFGFANYMFQTNQGPSFPAHQFLFSGTSAPVTNGTSWQSWFASENPPNQKGSLTGCWASSSEPVTQINDTPPYIEFNGTGEWIPDEVSGAFAGSPCYHHNSIATVLQGAVPSVSWKYYTNDKTSIWTAPNALEDICEPQNNTVPGPCKGTSFVNNVFEEKYTSSGGSAAQIYKDIMSCSLKAVTFVTPDGAWSDHSGSSSPALGPSWVANLVNLVGQNPACAGTGEIYWNDTVILITWDDWGGWYDHVNPNPNGTGYTNNTGQNYVYGFRVPLLAVSAYSPITSSQNQTQGYVSGAWTSGPQPTFCPGVPYCHDFGSILNFIEYVFGKSGAPLPSISASPTYPYADALAPDSNQVCGSTCPYSLSDFFNFNRSPNTFYPISVPSLYGPSYFIGYQGATQPPDND